MSAPACGCRVSTAGPARPWLERASGALAAALLVLMPKCPACMAAYVMAWTGLGLSLSAAASVRVALLMIAGAALLYVALGQGRRFAGKVWLNPQKNSVR